MSSRQSSFTSQDLSISQNTLASKDPRIFHGTPLNKSGKRSRTHVKDNLRMSSPVSVKDAEMQTSLTDHSGLHRKPETKDESTQCSIQPLTLDPTTTTSSSQTEAGLLANYPVEAHVTQIRVHHEASSGDSSSIPSSYDWQKRSTEQHPLPLLLTERPGSAFQTVQQHFHPRGRRGGVFMEEKIELSAQALPDHHDFLDTVRPISTPSS